MRLGSDGSCGPYRSLWLGLASLLVVACGGDDDDVNTGTPGIDGGAPTATSSDGGVDAGPAPGSAEHPAVLVAAFVRKPDGRNVYVGATPDVPTGTLDYSKFLEFESVDVTTYGGKVFVWDRESATMIRFTVNDELALVEPTRLSLLNFEATGMVTTNFISPTRAYTLTPSLASIVVWNPETMAITGTIPVPPHGRPADMETGALDGHRAGDYVIYPIVSTNYDAVTTYPGTGVAIVNALRDDEPVVFVNDPRCIGGDGGYVDPKGDFYLRAAGVFGRYATYGALAATARTCILRIKAGEKSFDPGYDFDFEQVVGSAITWSSHHLKDAKFVGLFRDPTKPIPQEPEYEDTGYKAYVYDIEAKTSVPYPTIEGATLVSNIEFEVDGVSYFQYSKTGSVLNGSTDVVALRESGIEKRFSLPELWALARIR